MKTKFAFAFVLVGKMLSSCGASTDTIDSTDVNNDKIYQSYELRYFESSAKLFMHAQYRVAGRTGTTVRLISPSNVSVDNKQMVYHDGSEAVIDTTGSYYKLETTTKTPAEHYTFAWTTSSGEVLTNILETPKALFVKAPQPDSENSLDAGITVELSGDDLDTRTTVTVHITSDSASNPVTFQKTVINPPSVTFTREELKEFPLGRAKIYVRRSITGHLESCNPDVGGQKSSSWYSKEIPIVITD
jgi:hypothetical protein